MNPLFLRIPATTRRMNFSLWGAALLCLFCCGVSRARESEVRLLSGTEQNGVWGTQDFQVNINALGLVRHVKVYDKEVVWQAAALYTSPVPPDGAAGFRTVQGEGLGNRGLCIEQPRMTTRAESGARIFEFDILVANTNVLAGQPLCKVSQKLTVTPNGEIHVAYDFEWLQTLRWNGFGLLIIFTKAQCKGRDYMVIMSDQIMAGKLDPGPAAECQIRFKRFKQLTVRPEIGPVHLVWDAEANCSLSWGGGQPELRVNPLSHPYRGFMYKGQKDRIAYRILLPVSQQ